MSTHPLIAAETYEQGTAKALRLERRIPSVIYGQGKETKNIAIDVQDFRRAYRVAGKATLIDIEYAGKKIPVLTHIIDLHPISGEPIHVDFHAVDVNKEVHAVVPIKTKGTPDAVKLLAGILMIQHDTINIKCLPKYLISSVEADLTPLKTFHDTVSLSDLTFPENITLLDPENMIIASVSAPRVGGDDADTVAEGEEGEEKIAEGEEKTSE